MNNSVWNTYSYNNLDSGFVVEDLDSVFNRIYSSNATNNTNDGFLFTSNNWTWAIDTRSNLNGRDGYRFSTSLWINVTISNTTIISKSISLRGHGFMMISLQKLINVNLELKTVRIDIENDIGIQNYMYGIGGFFRQYY